MYRQSEKNLLNSNISSTCPHNVVNIGKITAEIGCQVFSTPTNFNGFWHHGFVTAVTSLNGGQPNFAQCLAISWAGTLYIHCWGGGGSCFLTAFCQVQNSLCVQVLHSPVLAALLHGTRAVGVIGWAAISHVGHQPTF